MRCLPFILLLTTIIGAAQTITGGITITSGANLISPAAPPPVTGWALQSSVPPGFTSSSLNVVQFAHQVTGDLFYMGLGGSLSGCTATTSIFWSVAGSGTWTDITGNFPNTASCIRGLNIWPNANGTIVVFTGIITPSFSVSAYNWNGLTGGASIWTQISCGPGQCGNPNLGSSKHFTKDGFFIRADGVLCVAGGQTIYCQTAANGTTWSNQITNSNGFYNGTARGSGGNTACGGYNGTHGFVYGMDDFDAGDGRGEQGWAGGEGDKLQFDPYNIATLSSNFVDYVPDPNDCVNFLWHGDNLGVVHSPTSALIWRPYNGSSPFLGSLLAHIVFGGGTSPLTTTPLSPHPTCSGTVCTGRLIISPILYAGGTGTSSRYLEFAANTTNSIASLWYTHDDTATFTNLLPSFFAIEPNCAATSIEAGVTDKTKLYVHCTNTVTSFIDYWTYTF